jgi:hypothetical protein
MKATGGLPQQTFDDLRQKGYSVQPLFDATELQELSDLHHKTRPDTAGNFYTSAFQKDTSSRSKVRDSLITLLEEKMAASLPGYRIYGATFVSKKANSGPAMLPLHQDYSFLDPSGKPAITIWAPLSDVSRQNGCLTVVPASHHIHHIAANPRNPGPVDAIRRELETNYVDVLEMPAGMACLFDTTLLHGSYGNQSGAERTAAFLGMLPVGVTPRLHVWDKADPGKLSVYEVSEDFLLYFTPEQPFDDEQKSRATFLHTIDYVPTPVTLADIPTRLPFLTRTSVPVQPAPAPTPPTSGLGARIKRYFSPS